MITLERSKKLVTTMGLAFAAACGGGGGGASFDEIKSAVEMPSGTVDATTTPSVAEEYEKAVLGGTAKRKQNSTVDQACGSSGSITSRATGNENNARVDITLNDCCDTADCCQSGKATWYYSAAASTDFSYCANYDVALSCGDSSGDVQYEYCFSGTGLVYVIRVDGLSFAVTGSYSDGNGTLEITGENGSFSCTFTDHAGSCTGDGGSFEF